MKAHGNVPGPTQRPVLAGAIGGALGAIPACAVLWFSGGWSAASAFFGGSEYLLAVSFGLLIATGAIYGRVFNRAANDWRAGWLFGISYGFLIWNLGPSAFQELILQRPVLVGTAALGMFGAHQTFGLVLGLCFPWVHRLLQWKVSDIGTKSRIPTSSDPAKES